MNASDRKGKPRKKRGSSMAGGRWKRSALLVLMTVALVVLVVNGVYRLTGKALFDPPVPPPGSGYPAAAASGFAARFAAVYFNWDEQNQQVRRDSLALFFPTARDPQIGWDGKGVQRVLGQPVPAGIRAKDDQNAVISIAANLEPGGWTCMDVGVFAAQGGSAFAITSYTSYVACPPVAVPPAEAAQGEDDVGMTSTLRPTVEAFFKAYAASSQELSQVVTPGSGISGLRGTVTYVEIVRTFVPQLKRGEDETKRSMDIHLRWQTKSGGMVQQGYRLKLTQIGGRWFVDQIEGGLRANDIVPQQGGPAPPPASQSAQPTSSAPPSAGARPGGSATPVPGATPTPTPRPS